MTGTETTIIRHDADNKPVAVCVVSGRVERPNTFYPTTLKGEAARALFLRGVAIVHSHEVAAFIRGCNTAAGLKSLTTDAARIDRAWRLAGVPMIGDAADVKSAKPHGGNCPCPKCRPTHRDCRKINCRVCG